MSDLTRRAKLEVIADNVPNIQTLRNSLHEFKENGGSGIEVWLNQAFAQFAPDEEE